ncbi:hypothetical protein A9Q99_17550 [Gammaproteobacteria bacterium 45_16_T64]|nr:hypothetical protein A9Q99_17550 [Gammaproteobacteria bacterium 45_16_T64]
MSEEKKKIAEKLLEAQIEFVIDQATNEDFENLLKEEINHFYDEIDKLTLNDVVTPGQIKEVIAKYAKEMEIHGAVPELMGEIAKHVYNHPAHDEHTLNDILSDEQFKEVLDKSLEMEEFRERLIKQAISNPVYAALVSELLYNGIKDYATDNAVTKNIPGASSMMKLGKNMMNKAAPKLEKVIEENVKKFIEKNANSTLKQSEKFLTKVLDNEKISEISLEIWDKAKVKKLSSFRKVVSADDIEDFLVLGYEFWKNFRETAYFNSLIESGVDFFFTKYGESTLTLILEEVSIERSMLVDDAMRFAPPIIELLNEKGILAKVLRRRLEPFYFSDTTLAIL